MAIQQVGGQGVYVITGSGRDPRRTSNGQSWADLVTKQKYMLYKSAYDQAMREYEAGTITDKERQRRIDQLRKDIRQERTEIARFERGQLSENERRERIRAREELKLGTETIRTPSQKSSRTGTDDAGIPLRTDFIEDQEDFIEKQTTQRSNLERQINQYKKDPKFASALRDQARGNSIKARHQQAYDQNITPYNNAITQRNKVDEKIKKAQGDIELLRGYDQAKFEEFYNKQVLKGFDPSKESASSRASKSGVTRKQLKPGVEFDLEDVDYSAQIRERQDRIKDIERQIIELEDEPGADPVNVIQRAKEIGREENLFDAPRERRRLFGRRAEMQALGMEEKEDKQQVKEVESDPVSEMMAEEQAVDRAIKSPTEQRYIVQEGDTLGSVAQQYYGDPSRFTEIAAASGIQDPNRIEVGQELIIPQDQPQMPTAPVAEPVIEEVVEKQPIPLIQPKPAETKIGNALRQDVIDRQAREEEIRRNEELPTKTPDALNPLKPSPPQSPTPALTPAPTPTGQPRIQRLGKLRRYSDTVADSRKQIQTRPTPALQLIRKAFDPVRNLDRRDKQQVALDLLQQAKQAYGVSSKEYEKVKDQVLAELGRAIDPKQAKQMKEVKNLQETSPTQYYKLGDGIRGLSKESKQMVVQLFPVNDETKLDEIERLYKNAQQQLKLSVVDKSQKKKALDMLDLMYMAVISDKR